MQLGIFLTPHLCIANSSRGSDSCMCGHSQGSKDLICLRTRLVRVQWLTMAFPFEPSVMEEKATFNPGCTYFGKSLAHPVWEKKQKKMESEHLISLHLVDWLMYTGMIMWSTLNRLNMSIFAHPWGLILIFWYQPQSLSPRLYFPWFSVHNSYWSRVFSRGFLILQ